MLKSTLYMVAGTIPIKHKLHPVGLLLRALGFTPHLEDKAKDISQGALSDSLIFYFFIVQVTS